MGVSIGKLNLYVAAGGFNPSRVLPVVLDLGTNNPELLQEEFYVGVRAPRLDGAAYYEYIEEFVAALFRRFPGTLLQFEDFETKHARILLEKYRKDFLVFNDDIQGTAAIVLAGILGSLKAQGLETHHVTKQRILIVGAGNAAQGILHYMRIFLRDFGMMDPEI